MPVINVLDSSIYNRIAAGEVVERPASVVKELAENAIDAGAKHIAVSVYDGGLTRMRVTDDGCGIEKSELEKALLPHATSKIREVSDLDDIRTLGFRGEALASIASVSHVTIRSRAAGSEVGAEIRADGGAISGPEDAAAAEGTEITVDGLFYNTPVRAKFLKGAKSEEAEIASLVHRLILGNPDVAFRFEADDKLSAQSFGTGEEEAMIAVYGAKIISDCFRIDAEKNGVRIRGYIGKHHFTKPNRTYQSLFVNGRYVLNASVGGTIQSAYGSYLMKRQYPFYTLFLDLPAGEVDVNVHPNKTEVRFRNAQAVCGAVYSVISSVLDGTGAALEIVRNIPSPAPAPLPFADERDEEKRNAGLVGRTETKGEEPLAPRAPIAPRRPFDPEILTFADSGRADRGENAGSSMERKAETSPTARKADEPRAAEKKGDFSENEPRAEEKKPPVIPAAAPMTEAADRSAQTAIDLPSAGFRYIGQAMDTYLLFERDRTLYLVDQHAAHERLNYDAYLGELERGAVMSQPMLVPTIVNVNGAESEFLSGRLGLLAEMGFEIDEFGKNTYRVSAVPVALGGIRAEDFIADLLSDLGALTREKTPRLLREKIAMAACKASVKSGMKMTESEAMRLIERMKGNMGLKCPHGRPVAVAIGRNEIDKWFKRIV